MGGVDRPYHRARPVHPLIDFEAQMAGTERDRVFKPIVECLFPDAAAHLDNIAEARRC